MGASLLDVNLRRGDLLYVPRGFPHATSTEQLGGGHSSGSISSSQGRSEGSGSDYSTSLTLSLLTESIGLTADKLIRCLGGLGGGCTVGAECPAAAEVLYATPAVPGLRRTLPVGFLARSLRRARDDSNGAPITELDAQPAEWARSMVPEVARLARLVSKTLPLPRRDGQRRLLERLFVDISAAVERRTRALKAAAETEACGAESGASAESLEALHSQIWPASCRIFVQPAR